MEWLITNWEALLVLALSLLGLTQGAQWFRYVRLVSRLALVAWSEAEKLGILQDIRGADKLAPFMQRFDSLWNERFGESPPPSVQGLAVRVAAHESAMHKVAALATPK